MPGGFPPTWISSAVRAAFTAWTIPPLAASASMGDSSSGSTWYPGGHQRSAAMSAASSSTEPKPGESDASRASSDGRTQTFSFRGDQAFFTLSQAFFSGGSGRTPTPTPPRRGKTRFLSASVQWTASSSAAVGALSPAEDAAGGEGGDGRAVA